MIARAKAVSQTKTTILNRTNACPGKGESDRLLNVRIWRWAPLVINSIPIRIKMICCLVSTRVNPMISKKMLRLNKRGIGMRLKILGL
jgi:hypothetical protein